MSSGYQRSTHTTTGGHDHGAHAEGSGSAAAAVLHLASFTPAGILDELARELPDAYGVSNLGVVMPIFHKCALSTAYGRALTAVHGDARARERIEALLRHNPDVFVVRQLEGQPHALVTLAPAMAKAFATAAAANANAHAPAPAPTRPPAHAQPAHTHAQTTPPKPAVPVPVPATAAAAASPAHAHASSVASSASSSSSSVATPLDLQGILVAILRTSPPHSHSLTTLGTAFMARTKRSFNDACAAAGMTKTLSAFLRERPTVFRVEADARQEHPPVISLVTQTVHAVTPTQTPTKPQTHHTTSAMSSPAPAGAGAGTGKSVDLQGTLVSILRAYPRAMPIPTLATHFRERAGVAFKDTGVSQTLTEFLAQRPKIFRLEDDARPQHPRLVALADGPAISKDATAAAPATPAKAPSTSSSSSSSSHYGNAMASPSSAPAPAAAGSSDAQLELLVNILRHAPATPGSLPLATLSTVFKSRTGYRFDDANAAAAGKGTTQTLLAYLTARPSVFRLWTEGVNRTHIVALQSGKETTHTAATAGASPSTPSHTTPYHSTGSAAAAAASPSASAGGLDLQSELVALLRDAAGTRGTMSLVSLGTAFFSRTGQRFNDVCAASSSSTAGAAKNLIGFINARPAVFRMWTEGVAQMVTLVEPAARTPAPSSLPSTPLTGGPATAAPSPSSASAIDLQRVLVSLLVASPDPLPLNKLADLFLARTRFSFSEALAAADKNSKQGMTAWLRERADVFRVEAQRDLHPPLVSLVQAYRNRLRPAAAAAATATATATPSTPAAAGSAGSVAPRTPSASDLSSAFAAAAISTPKSQPLCKFWPKGFCHKGDHCSHYHDPQWTALNKQKAAEKAAHAERAATTEGKAHSSEARDDCPSTASGSASATATPGPTYRPRLSASESAAVELVCSLLPADGRPMLPSKLGDDFIKAVHGTQSWAEYSRAFNGGPSLQRWMERHPDRIVVDKSRGTTPGKVLIHRAQVEGASSALPSHPPHSSPASSTVRRVTAHSAPPPPATIIGWVCAILLESSRPTTQTDLGQAMRRRHGIVFVSVGSAAERALKAAGGDAAANALTMKAFLRAHPNYFSLQEAGDEIEVRLVDRKAAAAAAAAVAAGVAASPAPSAAASSSSYTTPHKSYHGGAGAVAAHLHGQAHAAASSSSAAASASAPAHATPKFEPTVKRGLPPTQGLPVNGWSGTSLSASHLLSLLIGQPAQAVVPVGSGFYPVAGRPFGTATLLSLLHRTPLASLWTAAFPDWETLYDFCHSHPSHFAPSDHHGERSILARWVVKDDAAVASVSAVGAPTAAEAGLLRTLEVVFRTTTAPAQQSASASGSDVAQSPSSPALSLDAIGRGFFMERGVPFESTSAGVALADFLLHFRNLFCFTSDGPLLVVRFRPMEEAQEQAQAQAQDGPVAAVSAPASAAPQPTVTPAPVAAASAPSPARKMPIAVLASMTEEGASVSVSAQVAPQAERHGEPSPLPTRAPSSVQRTVRMQVHVLGRDEHASALSVSADCVAELRDELTRKLDEDEGALTHAYFTLHRPIDGRALPPALTDEQLWALPKNSDVFALLL